MMSRTVNRCNVMASLFKIQSSIHFGFVSWSVTFLTKIESSGMLANSPSSNWYEDATARTEPSVLNDSDDMLVGYLQKAHTHTHTHTQWVKSPGLSWERTSKLVCLHVVVSCPIHQENLVKIHPQFLSYLLTDRFSNLHGTYSTQWNNQVLTCGTDRVVSCWNHPRCKQSHQIHL